MSSHLPEIPESKGADTRLQVINEMMRVAVSSLDMAEVFGGIENQVRRLIDHDWMDVVLRPEGADYHEICETAAVVAPVGERGTKMLLTESPAGEAIIKGIPVLRRYPEDNVYPLESAIAEEIGCRSAMFIPWEQRRTPPWRVHGSDPSQRGPPDSQRQVRHRDSLSSTETADLTAPAPWPSPNLGFYRTRMRPSDGLQHGLRNHRLGYKVACGTLKFLS